MNYQSFQDKLIARSRQFLQRFWENHHTKSIEETEDIALTFLEEYHQTLYPEQTLSYLSENSAILPLKIRTAELILKQINIYYLPYRLESLLPYCDPFTAVATFLNALNFTYEAIIQQPTQKKLAENIFKEFMEIEQYYKLESTGINEFPLYEAGATHDFPHFQNTVFGLKRALDIIDMLDQVQPRNYENQKQKILQSWHQQKAQQFDKIIKELTQ